MPPEASRRVRKLPEGFGSFRKVVGYSRRVKLFPEGFGSDDVSGTFQMCLLLHWWDMSLSIYSVLGTILGILILQFWFVSTFNSVTKLLLS